MNSTLNENKWNLKAYTSKHFQIDTSNFILCSMYIKRHSVKFTLLNEDCLITTVTCMTIWFVPPVFQVGKIRYCLLHTLWEACGRLWPSGRGAGVWALWHHRWSQPILHHPLPPTDARDPSHLSTADSRARTFMTVTFTYRLITTPLECRSNCTYTSIIRSKPLAQLLFIPKH